MAQFLIDPTDGALALPNGNTISPTLTQTEFREGPVFQAASPHDYGTHPWIHFNFKGGLVEGKPLLVSLCYYDQLLVMVSLTVNLYPPGPADWSNYSLEVEAATKTFHDQLLVGQFGKPTHTVDMSPGHLKAAQATLARSNEWRFNWGSVFSGHDSKGGGTSIVVRYGDRLEEANAAYRRAHPL